MPHRLHAQAGFTLIEATIATLVFTIGALGLLTMIYSSHQGVSAAESLTHATALARSRLDQLARLPYDDPLLTIGNHNDGANNLDETGSAVGTSNFGDNDGLYARSWSVNEPVGGLGFKTILVRVRWWDKSYRLERDVVLTGGKSQ